MKARNWENPTGALVLGAASLLCGLFHGAAFGSSHAAALQFIPFTVFCSLVFLLMARQSWGALFFSAAAFWTASTAIALRWIAAAVVSEHSLGIALGSLIYALLSVGLSSLTILCLWLATAAAASLRSQTLCSAILATALWIADLLRELLLPSFPWVTVGYAHVASAFAPLLPLMGVQGMSWMVEFTALLLGSVFSAVAATRRTPAGALACVILVGLILIAAAGVESSFTQDAAPLRVALMQTAISTKDKFKATLLAKHVRDIEVFAEDHDAQLILAPEGAVPTTLRALTPLQNQWLAAGVSDNRAVVFGAFAEDSRGDVFNSAVLLQHASNGPGVERTVYIKQHLAPIGEYAPPGWHWLTELLNLPMSNLRSTADTPRNFQLFGISVIPSVCQDLLYGDDLRTTTSAPRILVNLSNVAFFDDSLLRSQFINIARARALEQQIPVLIAGNYGPTAFIDAAGALQSELPPDTAGALEIALRSRVGATPYARFGNAFLYLIAALTAVATAIVARLR